MALKKITATLKNDKCHFTALLVIIIIAAAVRALFLFQPIRYDEAFTFIVYASKPIYIGLSSYYLPNNHLFHTLLVRIAYLLLGNEPWILRLPAFTAGILTVPATYVAMRILYNKDAAILSAALTASSSILIEYSTLARGYTFICLFFLILIILGTRIIQNDSKQTWYLFVAASTLGLFTIPTMLYPFGIVVCWLLLNVVFKDNISNHDIALKDLTICVALTFLLTAFLYIPVLTVSGFKSLFTNRFVISRSWTYVAANLPQSFFSTWTEWHRDTPAVLKFVLVPAFFSAVILHKKIARYRIPIVLPLLFFIFFMIFVQRVVPYNRVWLFLLPLYFGIACSGISYLTVSTILKNEIHNTIFSATLAVVISVCLSLNVVQAKSVYKSNELGTLRDAQQISFFLKDNLKAGDKVVVICPSDFPIIYYFDKLKISIDYLVTNPLKAEQTLKKANRILIIVNNHEQPLDDILKKIKFDKADYKILKKYKEACLYEISGQYMIKQEKDL